jgi:hypothetical protein
VTDNQKKWLEALRSGKYGQCKKKLQDTYGYCCLGVACVVARSEGVSVVMDDGYILGGSLATQQDVWQWLGLRSGYGVPRFGSGPALTDLNDSGKSFSEIADIIEAHPEEYFTLS